MGDNQGLYEEYADLLREDDDPELVWLVGILDKVGATWQPPHEMTDSIRRGIVERAQVAGGGSTGYKDSWWDASETTGAVAPPRLRQSGPRPRGGRGVLPSIPGLGRARNAAGLAAFIAVVAAIVLGLTTALPQMYPGREISVSDQRVGRVSVATHPPTAEPTPGLTPTTRPSSGAAPMDSNEEGKLARAALAFLDLRQFSIDAGGDREKARSFEEKARSYLTPEYNAAVRDLEDLDIPTVPSWVQPGDAPSRSAGNCRDATVDGARGTVECGWLADRGWESGRQLWRRLKLDLINGDWKVSGIERAMDSPQTARAWDALLTPAPVVPPATTVPGTAPAIQCAFNHQPGTRQILQQNLGVDPDLSQSVDGFTVSIRRAYADSGSIIIGTVITAPRGRNFGNLSFDQQGGEHIALTDEQGREIEPGAVSWGCGDADVLWFTRNYKLTTEERGMDYDSLPELDRELKELKLRLVVPALRVHEVMEGSIETVVEFPEPCDDRTHPVRCYRVEGPFIFNLRVPVEDKMIKNMVGPK